MNGKKLSRFLSLVLRHKPEEIGVELDEHGWANVDQLIQKMGQAGKAVNRGKVEWIVTENADRFSLSEDRKRIRANEGHTVKIDLGLEAIEPPEVLYHGTADRLMKSIEARGLQKRGRQHVHLTDDFKEAKLTGMRHGAPAILLVEARRMWLDGWKFYLTETGVWLTDQEIPVRYLERDA